jgi:CrcB protein
VSPTVIAAVLLAGALGALARFGVSRALASRPRFPWAVLLVNVVGSAIGGVVLGLAEAGGLSPEWRLILLTGFCGGLTTFSTFSVETVQLVLDGRSRIALGSVAANLTLGIAAAAAGYLLTR